MDPIKRIAKYASQPENPQKLLRFIVRWRTRKLAELQFISIACAVLAAAVIGSFSWNTVPNAYWLASALWHCTLVFSILGILLSAQQLVVLNILDTVPDSRSPSVAEKAVKRYLPLMLSMTAQPDIEAESQPSSGGLGKWKPRWKMVFTWQCPMMFMSYSVCLFLAGLTILVCTPLIRGVVWSEGANIAVVYLVVAATASSAFVFCSFWIYHYVDLEHDDDGGLDEIENVLKPSGIPERPRP